MPEDPTTTADADAGYRSVIDEEEAAELEAADPNLADGDEHTGDVEPLIGEPVSDDSGVAGAAANLTAVE